MVEPRRDAVSPLPAEPSSIYYLRGKASLEFSVCCALVVLGIPTSLSPLSPSSRALNEVY